MKLINFYNFSLYAVELIKSYLTDRSQSVAVKYKNWKLLPVKGVPQASVLGPLLSSLYINDLSHILKYSFVHLYADDVQLYPSYSRNEMINGIRNIKIHLNRIFEWVCGNGLTLNMNLNGTQFPIIWKILNTLCILKKDIKDYFMLNSSFILSLYFVIEIKNSRCIKSCDTIFWKNSNVIK